MNVAIDMGGLDSLTPNQGQHRYVLDLISGLASLDSPFNFLVLGTLNEPPARLREVFHQSHWRYLRFSRRTGKGSFYIDQLRLSWLLYRKNIHVCHCLHSLVPLVSRSKLLVTVYDLMFELFPEYVLARESRPYKFYRWAVRHLVKRVICISQATANDAVALWQIDRSKLQVINLGTSLVLSAGIAGTSECLLSKEKVDAFPLISSPFNLEPRKNLAALLEVVACLKPRYPGLRLVLFGKAGTTPERENDFSSLVDRLGICEQISLTGFLPDADLRSLLRRSTLFVFPTLYEGFGLPILEAMAAGTCVVVRDASSMAEIVGDAGVRADTQNVSAFAAAIDDVLRNSEKRDRLVQAGRKRAQQFSIRTMAEQTLATYETVLSC